MEDGNVDRPAGCSAILPDCVSVVVISHNRPALLDRAIESVFAQEYRPIELLLVDNQSKPPIPARGDAPDGVRLVHLRTPRKLNASAARNFAVQHASGGLIAFLDDDDFFLPGSVGARATALREASDIDVVYMNTRVFGPDGAEKRPLKGTPNLPFMLEVHLNAIMTRREVALAEPFDERITKDVDDHFTIRVFNAHGWRHIDEFGAVWHDEGRPDQITRPSLSLRERSSNLRQKYANIEVMCNDFAPLIDRDADMRQRYYGRHAKLSLANLRPVEALKYWLAARGMRSGQS